jgi:limonene-1,2-epoxide hydrolase
MPRALSRFEAQTHRLAATGPVVLTERTDVLVVGRVRVAFWVCGTFEVQDGRITLWRDYFDWAATTAALVSGVARALGSLLRGGARRVE